ncbi:MAG: hypothetical protein ACI4I9_06150 [Porcipelethomonas sp.]
MKKYAAKVDEEKYDHCRNRMNEINRKYRFSFLYSVAMFTAAAFLSVFRFRFEVISAVASVFDISDGFISSMLGGLIQILSCVFFTVAAYFAWANFHKLNIVFMLFYLLMFMMSIKNKNWFSLIISLPGIFLYCISSSALLEERELSQESGYPNFQIPVEQMMNDAPEKEEYRVPGNPELKSDYDDFFTGKTDIPVRENHRED